MKNYIFVFYIIICSSCFSNRKNLSNIPKSESKSKTFSFVKLNRYTGKALNIKSYITLDTVQQANAELIKFNLIIVNNTDSIFLAKKLLHRMNFYLFNEMNQQVLKPIINPIQTNPKKTFEEANEDIKINVFCKKKILYNTYEFNKITDFMIDKNDSLSIEVEIKNPNYKKTSNFTIVNGNYNLSVFISIFKDLDNHLEFGLIPRVKIIFE